jgi:hypothetical protein
MQEKFAIRHNSGTKCYGENCPICYFNQSTSSAFRGLEGRLLTIVDAITENEGRKKAIKDLVKDAVWKTTSSLESLMFSEMPGGSFPILECCEKFEAKRPVAALKVKK